MEYVTLLSFLNFCFVKNVVTHVTSKEAFLFRMTSWYTWKMLKETLILHNWFSWLH